MKVRVKEIDGHETIQEFDAAPRVGDIVHAFGNRLTVIEAEWDVFGTLMLRVADTLKGHQFVMDNNGWWTCTICEISIHSSVPPTDRFFPKRGGTVTDQDFISCKEYQVARVMKE